MSPPLIDTRGRTTALLSAVLFAAAATHIGGCASQDSSVSEPAALDLQQAASSTISGEESDLASPVPEGPQPQPSEEATRPPDPEDLKHFTADLDPNGPLIAHIETNHGRLVCQLFAEDAPVTVANFVGLARGLKAYVDPISGSRTTGRPYYDGVEFHRVLPGVLIQTGARGGAATGGPGYTIPDEISEDRNHDRSGVMSMAHRGVGTAGSQFFITERPLPELDARHTVFGQCDPAETIRTISHVPTMGMNRPVDPAPRIEAIRFHRGDS